MYKIFIRLLVLLNLCFCTSILHAQQQDRFQIIQKKLDDLSVSVQGLHEDVQLQVTGIFLQDYLNALAKSNNLSISVDPKLNFTVYDTFNSVTAENIIVFLAKKYNLDVSIVGSIIYITPYQDPEQFKKYAKEIKAQFNQLDNTLSLDLDNDSLVSVAHKITQISNINVSVPTALQGKKVSGFISKAPFESALEKLAFSNEIKMVKTNDNFYLFQPLGDDEELYVTGDKNTSVRRTYKQSGATAANGNANVYSKVVNGQKSLSTDVVNAPIADLVKAASQELNKNYSIYSDLKGTITLHVNDVTYDEFLNILFKGTELTYHVENNVYLIGDRRLEGLRTYKVIQLQNRSIDTVIAMIPSEWKKNIEIKEFREQNTLLLAGSSAQIAEMEAFIKQLDVLVPSVMIEVTMIDIHKTRGVSTGISAGVADSVKTGGTVLPGFDFTFSTASINSFLNSVGKITSVNLGHVVPNFYVSLSALETNNNVDVRSVPKLTALNGHSATLSIGNTLYYKNTTQNIIPSTTTTQSVFTNAYIETNANMAIAIKPIISGNDQITLAIKIDISDFTSIPTDGSPPPKSTSKYETSLRVNNEDMILLGGIERTEKDDNVSGFPILSRIPILKYIFSSKSRTTSKVITVLFIKPTILR